MRLRMWRPALTALVAACSLNEPVTLLEQPITPVDAHVWSGDTLLLYSRWFTGADTVPAISIGPSRLAATAADTYLVRVVLPETTGTVALAVRFSGGRVQLSDTVSVYGLSRRFEAAALHGFPAFAYGLPILRGLGDSGIIELNVYTGRAEIQFPLVRYSAQSCARGPFVSTTGLRVGLRGGRPGGASCEAIVLDYASGWPVVVDSFRATQRVLMHRGQGRWLSGGNHVMEIVSPADTVSTPLEDVAELVASPFGSLVFPVGGGAVAGVPVFDTAGIAYRFTEFRFVLAAAFSADGDTAFVIGGRHDGTRSFRAVDVATGATYRARDLTGCCGGPMAAEPDRPEVYVVHCCGPYLHVLDRENLTEVARIRMPLESHTPRVFLDAVRRRLYVTQNYDLLNLEYPGYPTTVLVYELKP